MRRFLCLATSLALAACTLGCGATRPVDPDAAVATLRAALDTWKGGQAAGPMAPTPGFVVGDPRWQAGYRLLDYRTAGPPAPSGLDLRCAVDLWLQGPRGKKLRERADYIVTTHPARTVIRADF